LLTLSRGKELKGEQAILSLCLGACIEIIVTIVEEVFTVKTFLDNSSGRAEHLIIMPTFAIISSQYHQSSTLHLVQDSTILVVPLNARVDVTTNQALCSFTRHEYQIVTQSIRM